MRFITIHIINLIKKSMKSYEIRASYMYIYEINLIEGRVRPLKQRSHLGEHNEVPDCLCVVFADYFTDILRR